MRHDKPIERVLDALSKVLVKHRLERKWTTEQLADATVLSVADVYDMEIGRHLPTMKQFFRLASGLGEEPVTLFIKLAEAWRADPTDTLHKSRPSDFAQLFRLGYYHKPGDFRELSTSYYSVAEATHAAEKLNAQRHTRGVALLDTVCVYVRLDSVGLQAENLQCEGGQP